MNPANKEADAFDDLLGQLVDELAMTPAAEPEPEPVPEPIPAPAANEAPMVGAVDMVMQAPPQKSNTVAIAGIIGGAILVVGLAAVFIIGGNKDKDEGSKDEVAQKTEQPKAEQQPKPVEPPPLMKDRKSVV